MDKDKVREEKMKKILKLLFCFCMSFIMLGCQKEELFDQSQVYTTEEVTLSFRALEITKEVRPINQNDEYFYRYSKDEDVSLVDVQFYVENNTDQEIVLNEYLKGEMIINDLEMENEICIETDHYTNVNEEGKLLPRQKSVAHVIFYLYSDELAIAQSENKPMISLYFDNQKYYLPIEEQKVMNTPIERNELLEFERFNFQVLSASASQLIPSLNFDTEDYEYYQIDDAEKQYVGSYLQIENKTNETINLIEELPAYVNAQGQQPQATWFSVLTQDQAKFEEFEQIPPNETRTVLVFQEIPLDYEDTDYTFHFIIDGKNYTHTFTHLVIAR